MAVPNAVKNIAINAIKISATGSIKRLFILKPAKNEMIRRSEEQIKEGKSVRVDTFMSDKEIDDLVTA